jgi:CubicO group peptidase (beta-lactamase class C family)
MRRTTGSLLGPPLVDVLEEELATWPGPGAVAVVTGTRVAALCGDRGPFAWASVTKLLTALVALRAVERGAVTLDEPAGPAGSTVRHLLAHASGLSFDEDRVQAEPGTRRIYSNRGIEVVADHVAARTGTPFPDLLADGVLGPLGMSATRLAGSPAHGAVGPIEDLARLAAELLRPQVLPAQLLGHFMEPVLGDLAGLLPGFGRQDPNGWGLGFEVRGSKSPHWTGTANSPGTVGHFGRSGSFLWVDRDAGVACAGLSATDFGPWAAQVWPRLADRVLGCVA